MDEEIKQVAADMAEVLTELDGDLNSTTYDHLSVREYRIEFPVLRRKLANVVRRYRSLKREEG